MENYVTSDSQLSSNDSLSSSSSDSELEIIIRRRKIYSQRVVNLNLWTDNDFFQRFRLSKPAVTELLNHIRNDIETPTNKYVEIIRT